MTRAWMGIGLVLALATTAQAQGREEVIYFEKEPGEGWFISADGTDERMFHGDGAAYASFEEWLAAVNSVKWSWQVPPASMSLSLDTKWEVQDGQQVGLHALVLVTNGERRRITEFHRDVANGMIAEDGQRVVFMREGSLSEGFKTYVIDLRDPATTPPRYLTTCKRGVGFGWLDAPARTDGVILIERLPAEMSVRGNYGSFFSSDRDREVSQLLVEQIQDDEAPPSLLVEGIGRLPVQRMTANELRALYSGLDDAGGLMAWSPLKYSIFKNARSGACVSSAEKRSEVLSAELGEDWTVTSIGWTGFELWGKGVGHHYNVATYWGEDGTAYHFSMDSYLVVPSIKYLGCSGEEFPGALWFSLDQDRTQGSPFFRAGEKLTTLDGVPVEEYRFDRAALESARQADARLREFTWREVTASPPRATRFGRTYLPFQLTILDPVTRQPRPNVRVALDLPVTGQAKDQLTLMEEKGAPGGRELGAARLMLTTDDAGRTPVAYLVVTDPYLLNLTDVPLRASVEDGGSTKETFRWEVLDNLGELERCFRDAFPAGLGSSIHEEVVGAGRALERVPFMSDVVLRGLGDDGSGYTIDRVLSFLTSTASHPERAHLLNGLLYHPVWIKNRGAVHFATAVYPEADSTGAGSKYGRIFDAAATRSPVSYEPDVWSARFGGPDQELALEEGLGDGPAHPAPELTVLVSCPVEVLFTDAAGRRVGFADGAHVNELARPLGHTRQELPEADGTTAKLLTYSDANGELTIVGQGDGTFSLDLLYHQPDGSALWVEFVDVPIMAGESVTFPVDAMNVDAPGERSGGGLVFSSGPAIRVNPPPPPGGRRRGGGCSMAGAAAATTPGLPAAASLALLALLAWGRRRAG